MFRQPDLDSVPGSDLQQFLDLGLGWRRCSCRSLGDWNATLEEHLFETGGGNGDQHLRRLVALILEGVRRSDRHVGEHPRRGDDTLLCNLKGDLAFENVEALFLAAVNMRRMSTTGRHDRFPQGVLAVCVVACGQKALHVTDDSDRAAFAGFCDSWLVWHVH